MFVVNPTFPLGRLVMTRGVNDLLAEDKAFAKFVTESMKEEFNDTAIIMMGCDCLHFEDLAQAFIEKGASTYIAWDVSVGLNYVDDATPAIIDKLCSRELTIEAAVAETMKEKGPDPDYGAVLNYYPRQSGDKTLRQIIK